MLFSRSPFKSLFRSFTDGVFNIPINKGEPVPPIETDFLVDKLGNFLLDKAGDSLVYPVE
jgi:hypothetical protein